MQPLFIYSISAAGRRAALGGDGRQPCASAWRHTHASRRRHGSRDSVVCHGAGGDASMPDVEHAGMRSTQGSADATFWQSWPEHINL